MRNGVLHGVIGLFALGFMLQLLSGAWLFGLKFGSDFPTMMSYFYGNEAAYIAPKSVKGLMKSVVPHLLGFGVVVFIFGHLLMMVKDLSPRLVQGLLWSLVLGAFGDVLFHILIPFHSLFLGLKLGSFLLFEISLLTIIILVMVRGFRRMNRD